MKSVIKDRNTPSPKMEYPCLVQNVDNSEIVVLATGKYEGIAVSNKIGNVGIFVKDWSNLEDLSYWKPFEGTLELSN
jgi:hypothetical protein